MGLARLFTHGGSQAVRLPREFRFEGIDAVHVRRVGDDVVLSAAPPPTVEGLIAALDAFEPGVRLEREAVAQQERAAIRPRR
jgi:antitoxin VapB